MLCSDECLAHSFGDGGPYAKNSYCQDGADGDSRVTGTACAYGTDCTDCGPRYYMPPSPPFSPPPPSAPPPYVCENTCRSRFGRGGPKYANNTHCQDGGPGAEGDMCMLGTDCDDCGLRYTLPGCACPLCDYSTACDYSTHDYKLVGTQMACVARNPDPSELLWYDLEHGACTVTSANETHVVFKIAVDSAVLFTNVPYRKVLNPSQTEELSNMSHYDGKAVILSYDVGGQMHLYLGKGSVRADYAPTARDSLSVSASPEQIIKFSGRQSTACLTRWRA